jgi:hypothetical protein
MRYRYRIEVWPLNDSYLNELGDAGWRLVTVHSLSLSGAAAQAIFIREVEDESFATTGR